MSRASVKNDVLAIALVGSGVAFALGSAAQAAVQIKNPSNLTDREFECLKGIGTGCAPARIQENWVTEGQPNFSRINEWTSNNAFTARSEIKQTWPLSQNIPFTVTYSQATKGVVFELNYGGSLGVQTSSFAPLTRSPSINSLFIRASSGSNNTSFQTSLTNLKLSIGSAASPSNVFTIGDVVASGLTDGREVKYALVSGLPDSDFTITGVARFAGPNLSGNWQIKAAYSEVPVPGPLPLLGSIAAFGWSRKLRARILQAGSRSAKHLG